MSEASLYCLAGKVPRYLFYMSLLYRISHVSKSGRILKQSGKILEEKKLANDAECVGLLLILLVKGTRLKRLETDHF